MRRFGSYIFLIVLVACSPRVKIKKILTAGEVKFQDHAGLVIYDPATKKTLVDYQGDKYFTPASNTKIFTFFSSLQLLGDSIPALRYEVRNDSLIFWGTGDPSFLYPAVTANENTFNFLKGFEGSLFFSASNFYAPQFGPGWAWDDYVYDYSPERSAFPLYGNLITISDTLSKLTVTPARFENQVSILPALQKTEIERSVGDNKIVLRKSDGQILKRRIPFHVSPQLIAELLSDTLSRGVTLVDKPRMRNSSTLYSLPADSLYKVMMQESDNFIAEQLLLMCADVISDTLDSNIAINYVKKNFLQDLPDKPLWVDGSGLSRYNLFTPRSIVALWDKILKIAPRERLFQLLAVGGKAGTIQNLYKGETPYVYGKTGTLSNNHCLSGFLITKKNRLLIFSIMNSNYTVPGREIRSQMELILQQAHERF